MYCYKELGSGHHVGFWAPKVTRLSADDPPPWVGTPSFHIRDSVQVCHSFSGDWGGGGKVKRTGRILAAADLNELLDVGDFTRHNGQRGWVCDW